MAVPYTFGTATSSIPLSQLDSNFNTVITLGNTAIQLGNTVTTLNNMTLANVTISSGNVTITNVAITTANVTTANITTAVIGTETVTTSTITTANVTTANITTDNITNGTVITSLTLSYGTANGVAYLNGSKVLTTGSALTFDGTNFATTGTATAAKLIPTGSSATGNGLYLPAANSVGISTNGTNAVYIDASQNVGIGTTSTSDAKVSIGGTVGAITTASRVLQVVDSAGGALFLGSSNSSYSYLIHNTSSSTSQWLYRGGVGVTLDSSGNVGIGTSSPTQKLEVSFSDTTTNRTSPVNVAAITATSTSTGGAVYTGFGPALVLRSQSYDGTVYSGPRVRMVINDNSINTTAGSSLAFDITATKGASPTQAAIIDSSGNLGLGVTPSAWGQSGTLQAIQIKNTAFAGSGTNAYWGSNWFGGGFDKYITTAAASLAVQTGGQHIWYNAPSGTAGNAITFTQAMTLDANGRLSLGTTTILGSSNRASFSNDTSAKGVLALQSTSTSGYSAVELYDNSGTQQGAMGWGNGSVAVTGAQSATYLYSTGAITFLSGGTTERARIDSSGNLQVGTTSASLTNTDSQMFGGSANNYSIFSHINGTGSGAVYQYFAYNATSIGSITQSGTTAVLYNVTSDQRLKENIQDADSASSLIDSLQVRKFDWITDKTHQRYGFVAQELVTVAPEAVHQPADPEEMMAVDYSKLVPMLVKEIQSLRKRLTALEST